MAARGKRRQCKKNEGEGQARKTHLQKGKPTSYAGSKSQPARKQGSVAKQHPLRERQTLPNESPCPATKTAWKVCRDSARRDRQEMRRGYAELKRLIENGLAAFELFREEIIVAHEDTKYVLRGMDERLRRLEAVVLPDANNGNEDMDEMLRHDIYQDPEAHSGAPLDDMEEERFSDAFAAFCDDF